MAYGLVVSSLKRRASGLLTVLVVLPALAVGLVSYNFMSGYVRADRVEDAGQAAGFAHRQLAMLLGRVNDRASSFLTNLASQCRTGAGTLDRGCAGALTRSYLASERALGATLRWEGGKDLVVGATGIRREEDWAFHTSQLAKLSEAGVGGYTYFVIVRVPSADASLAVTYPSSGLRAVFDRGSELGDAEGVLLADGNGAVVAETGALPAAGQDHPIAVRSLAGCLVGDNTAVVDGEYRGKASLLGVRAVPEIGSGCIVAHIDRASAFAPLAAAERKAAERKAAEMLVIFLIPIALAAIYLGRRMARTDAALQGALSLKQSILATSPAGFVAYRQDGQCVMANPTASRTIGGAEYELLRQNFHQLASWQETGLLDRAERVLATGKDVEYETELTTTFGRHIWVHCHFSRFFTLGEPYLLVMLHDITEARHAERALKESEEFNRRMIASSSDCINVLDLDGNLISMSEGGRRLMEIGDVDRYLGSCWIDFWHERDQPGVRLAIEAARDGEVGHFAAYCPTEKGKPKWWDVVITPITAASGKIERLLAVSRDVTGRKEEEEQFTMMIRTSLDGFWITDERGRLLEVNDAYCEQSGYTREELLGMSIPDLDAIEAPEDTERHIGELMACGSVRFETRHRRKDGQIIDIEVSAKYTAKYGSKIYCFLRDITARRRSEKLLEEQRQHLEREVLRRTAELVRTNEALAASFREADDLYQNAPCGYHSLDRDGAIVRINDTEMRMLGYPRDEILGKNMRDLLTPKQLARFGEDFARLKADGYVYGVETEFVRKDGSVLPVMVNATAIRDEQGQFLQSRATVYDMTEQHQADRARLRLNRALRLLSEGNAALMHAEDEQGLLDSICRLVVETGGYLMAWVGSAEQDAAQSIRAIARFGDNDGYLDSLDISWAEGGRGGRGPTATAIRLGMVQVNQNWRDNCSLRPWFTVAQKRGYQSSIALPINSAGRTLGALNIYSGDPGAFVPEEVRLLEELANNLAFGIETLRVRGREAEANRELKLHRSDLEILVSQRTAELSAAKIQAEQANNAKSRFLAAASHDLRQPLTALKLYVGVLKGKLGSEHGQLLMNMQECIGGLGSLLSKLLDLSKLDAGVVKPRVSSFSVDDLLNTVVAAHAPDAEAQGLSLRHRYCGLTARTDPVLFRRIIGNLVANAIRYTERGGVLIGCRRRAGKTWVEVWDTGIGIPPDKTGEIFEEFKQLGDDARTYGSGLGLTIVAKTAELLGLQMRVQSRPLRGSMFAIELPRGKKAQPAMPPAARNPGRSLRIAVVDDNPAVLNALVCGLESAGHQVVAAASGSDLQSRLGAVAPDIAVCDHRLGAGETGFDVIEAVRATFGSEVPAMIITGDTDPHLIRSMTRKGIVILHKPVELADLEERVEDAANRSPASPAQA